MKVDSVACIITAGGDEMARPYTEARREANARYDEKTYTQFNVRLRKEDDKDILESIQAAHESGLNNREWLRELFDNTQSIVK